MIVALALALLSGSGSLALAAAPTITANTANLATNAPTLTVIGSGFSTVANGNTIVLSSGAATVTPVSTTQLTLTFTTAPSVGVLNLTVTVSASSSAATQVAAVVAAPTVTLNAANRAQNIPSLTINGSGFSTTTANTVVLSSGTVGTVTAVSVTQLTVTLTAQPSLGNLTAVVTSNGGNSGAAVQVATVVASPTITSSTANLAINASSLTINGSGFATTTANAVILSTGTVGTVTAVSSTQLTVTLTAQPSLGNLTATVTSNGGSVGPTQVASVVAAPTVTLNTASRAQNATSITINGSGFSTTTANTVVLSSGTVGTVTAVSSSQLTVTLTAQSSLGNLTAVVTSNGGTSGAAIQVAAIVASPTIISSTANLAQNSPTLTINGSGFSTTTANTVVLSSGTVGTVTAVSATQLTVTLTAPPSVGNLNATVTSNGGSVGPTQVATVVASPTITLNTSNLAVNAPSLTINGFGFSTTTANAVVLSSGTVGTVTAVSASQLTVTFTAPPSLGNLTATVTSNNGNVGPTQVATIVAAPTVTMSVINLAQNAPTLTINGSGFSTTTANTVVLSSGTVGIVTAVSATQLTVSLSAPPTAGNLSATVTSNSGSSGAAVQVATVVPNPTVTLATASLAQNAPTLLITGTNFSINASDNTVTLNLGAAGAVMSATATQLTVMLTTQPTSLGNLTAKVSLFGGNSGAVVQVATIVAAPMVTLTSPNILQSASTLTITGTNFSTTLANNTVSLSSGTGMVTAATASQLTVTFATQPNTGVLTAIVTSSGGSSGMAVKVANVGIAPAVTSVASTTLATTVPGTYTITGTGTPLPNYSVVPELPNGVAFTDNLDGTATLSGTPKVFGIFNLTITAQNGFGTKSIQPFTLQINATLTATTPPNPLAGAAYNQTFVGSGGTAPYTFALQTGELPTGLTLSPSGILSGTPTATGPFSFALMVLDSSQSEKAGPFSRVFNYTFNVASPKIIITPGALLATNANSTAIYSQALSASGGTAPYTFSLTTGSLPPGILMSSSGAFTGTATAEGLFAFSVTATDSSGGSLPHAATVPYSIFVNHAPVIVSGPTATPSTTQSGLPVQFNVSVTDVDNEPLEYAWNFTDGTTSSLPNPTHVFTTPGTHTVLLSVVDHHGAQATGQVSVIVQDTLLTGVDSDGDGYSDEIEIALGSNPNDATSTPLDLPLISSFDTLDSVNLSIGISFVASNKDSIVLTGTLPLPTTFLPAGQRVIVDVGGVVSSYTLQKSGKSTKNANAANSVFSIQNPLRKAGNAARGFSLVMKKGNFNTAFSAFGLVDIPANAAPAKVPVTIIVNNTRYSILAPQYYTTSNFQTGTTTSP